MDQLVTTLVLVLVPIEQHDKIDIKATTLQLRFLVKACNKDNRIFKYFQEQEKKHKDPDVIQELWIDHDVHNIDFMIHALPYIETIRTLLFIESFISWMDFDNKYAVMWALAEYYYESYLAYKKELYDGLYCPDNEMFDQCKTTFEEV